jgi:hypothetical protein
LVGTAANEEIEFERRLMYIAESLRGAECRMPWTSKVARCIYDD